MGSTELTKVTLSETLPRRRQDLRVREIHGDVLLYDPIRDSVHFLNASAYFVWQLCTGAHTVEQIRSLMHAEFDDVDQVTIERDVGATLTQLLDDSLLESECSF